MKIHQKNYLKITLIFNFILLFFSCNKGIEYEKLIPEDAQIVTIINPKTVAEKGNLTNLDQYQFFQILQNSILNESSETVKLWNEIKNNPNKIGIDLNSPFYIFGTEIKQKMYVGIVLKMNKKNDFEDFISQAYQINTKKKPSFYEKNDFTFIEGFEKPLIGWNKNSVLILASEYGNINQNLSAVFSQIVKQETSLYDNPSFNDVVNNAQDISIWLNNDFMAKFSQRNDSITKKTYKNNWVTHLNFVNDGIAFTYKFHPDPNLKKILEKKPVWKKSTNSDFFSYLPAKSYANVYFDLHGEHLYSLIDEQKFLDNFLDELQINIHDYPNSFEGSFAFSVFDFKNLILPPIKSENEFGEEIILTKETSIPQFALISKMKDDKFFNTFIQNNSDKIESKNNYWNLKVAKDFPIYIGQNQHYLYVTNNENQIEKFFNNQIDSVNFKQSEFAKNAKHPLYAYVNLDINQYPIGFQDMLYNALPKGGSLIWKPAFDQLDNFTIRATDSYTKTGKIQFKNSDKNALETLLLTIDKTYTNLFLQNNNGN